MNWYSIANMDEPLSIRQHPSLEAAYLEAYKQQKWHIKIQPIRLTLLTDKGLLGLIQELQQGIKMGLTLMEVLSHLSSAPSNTSRMVCLALLSELAQGHDFNKILKSLCHKRVHSYCDLFVQNSTPEQLLHSLTLLNIQLHELQQWSKQLPHSMLYPFFVIQLSLIIWLANHFFQIDRIGLEQYGINLGIYLLVTVSQGLLLLVSKNGTAAIIIETFSESFRLNKLFCLLNASLSTGLTLQASLQALPYNFNHKKTQQALQTVYYNLRLGHNYSSSFPEPWFPAEAKTALTSSSKTGDIERALTIAANIHALKWKKTLAKTEKIIPALSLSIAGYFVAQALISIYQPLLEMH